MATRAELTGLCVQVNGFPRDIHPQDVAQCLLDITHIPVQRIAPADCSTSESAQEQIWIVQLNDHNDQKRYLKEHKTFQVTSDTSTYEVTLSNPFLSHIPSPESPDWKLLDSPEDQSFTVLDREVPGRPGVDPSQDTDTESFHIPSPATPQAGHDDLPSFTPSQHSDDDEWCQSVYVDSRPAPLRGPEFPGHTTRRPGGHFCPADSPEGSLLYDDDYDTEMPLDQSLESVQAAEAVTAMPPTNAPSGHASVPRDLASKTWVSGDPQQNSSQKYRTPGPDFLLRTGERDDTQMRRREMSYRSQQDERYWGEQRPQTRPVMMRSAEHRSQTSSGGLYQHTPVSSRQSEVSGRPVPLTKVGHLVKNFTQQNMAASKEELPEEEPLRTVEVTVGQPVARESQSMYRYYFENERLGGGDVEEVEEVDQEKGVLHVTFVSPEVAKQVSQRQHTIGGRRVEVKLYVPPKPRPTYPNKLLFENVDDMTSKDSLRYYVENVTGMEPHEVRYGDEAGVVLITFESEPDLASVKKKCEKKSLEGRQLRVSRVPITNCVLVENLAPNATRDVVKYYFLSKRGKGGEIEKLVLETGKDNCRCYVYFEDHEVVDRVLATRHVLEDRELKVTRYMECLGVSGGSTDPRVFAIPKPLVLTHVNKHKLAFLRHNADVQERFSQTLAKVHALPTMNDTALTLTCTLQPNTSEGRTLARTWTEHVQQEARSFLDQIDVCRVGVMEQVRPQLETSLSDAKLPGRDQVVLQQLPEENALVVVGMKAVARKLHQQVGQMVKEVEDVLERRKQEITETMKNLKPFKLSLLHAMSFPEEVSKTTPDVTVTISLENNTITFHGLMNDVKQAQVDMLQRLESVVSVSITDFTETQKKLLRTEQTRDSIAEKLSSKSIVAVLDNGGEVHAFNEESGQAAIKLICSLVAEHVYDLGRESEDLLKTSDWHTLKKTLEERHPGQLLITPSHDNRKVYLTADGNILHGVLEDVQRFLQENTIYTETLRFSDSRQKFINLFRKHDITAIGKELKAYRVRITITASEITVQGTSQGLQQAKVRLLALDEQVVYQEEVISDPKKVKFLNSERCVRDLDTLGRSHQCVISFQPEAAGFQHGGPGFQGPSTQMMTMPEGSVGNLNIMARAQLPGGATVAAVLGDITQMEVDVIVNAANNRMEHIGGLAKAIVDRGGKSIQDECYRILKSTPGTLSEGDVLVSGPGTLPCKSIIHAVGPVYKGGRAGEDDCLEATVINCLEKASSANHKSIALPAISTGVFHYPVAAATKVMVSAVKKYMDVHRKCSIRAVYLCHTQADILQHFSNAIRAVLPAAGGGSLAQTFPPMHTSSDFESAGYPTGVQSTKPKSTRRAGRVPSTAPLVMKTGSLNIKLHVGELAKEKVDVIVNTTAKNLNLQNGAVSSSILTAAGPSLQTECKRKYPQGIDIGDIARTSGASLACREVFHIVLCQWKPGQAAQITQLLSQIIHSCLTEASNSQYTSISFPVLGTGNLQYPRDVVAQTMLNTIHQFQQATPSTSLTTVKIVVYQKDTPTLQVFQQAQRQSGVVLSNAPQPSGGVRQQDRFRPETGGAVRFPSSMSSTSDVSQGAEFDMSGLRLVIKPGDITDEDVDALVNSSNGELDLSRGGVANALRDKCGHRLIAECKRKVKDMMKDGLAWTEAYGLKSRLILHVNAEQFTESAEWEAGIKDCFTAADRRSIQTLAMPALGTGAYAVTPDMSATFLYKALKSFCSSPRLKLREVRVVLYDSGMVPAFVMAVQDRIEKDKGGILNRLKGFVGRGSPGMVQLPGRSVSMPTELTGLYIYAGSHSDIQTCLAAFGGLVNDKFTTQPIDDKTVVTLEADEIERIMQAGSRHDVDVDVQTNKGRVILQGLQSNVPSAMTEINAILRSAMLASLVQWYYIEVGNLGTEQIPYGPKENNIIEDAFQNGQKSAQIRDKDGNRYKIDFDSMKESNMTDPSEGDVDVVRKIKMKGADSAWGELPPSWGSMKKDDDVILVPLQSSDPEYQDVEKNFQATIANANITVTGVKRVQNPTLYRQYSALKSQMERQNPGITNERTLWHGTAADALDNINRYGFNRSYCGKNAIQYGQGVYFAVQSSYSASTTYSPPDTAGNRFMYQCKVLVGHSTQGNRQMRVLPPRQGHIAFDSAHDNPQNPWMYVIFNDTQAYPEYLVTFQ